jgi:hypothetical protein
MYTLKNGKQRLKRIYISTHIYLRCAFLQTTTVQQSMYMSRQDYKTVQNECKRKLTSVCKNAVHKKTNFF